MKHLLIILALLLPSCAVDNPVGEVPPTPQVPPTAPYITCIEVYDLVQDCDTREPLAFQEGYTTWSFHAGEFTMGSQYTRTRLDILNPLVYPTSVWVEITYDDNCLYGTPVPLVNLPETNYPLASMESVTVLIDELACPGRNYGEHIITVKVWDEYGQPLETIIIGYTIGY